MRRQILARAGRLAIGAAVLAAALPAATADAQQGPDWSVPSGRFFTQTGGGGGKGYVVSDADGVEFWKAFQGLGGVDVVGYPVSQRFMHGGFVTQAMQKAVFQWRPESKSVAFVNVFDDLARAGRDQFLLQVRSTPGGVPFPAEAGKPFDEVVKIRQAALDARPAMKAMYFAAQDPILQYGLPTSQIMDMGNHYAIRLQRAVIQEWKQDVPWAKAGQATVANGGDIGKEAGLWPPTALPSTEAGATPASPAAAAPAAPATAPAGPAAAPSAPPAPAAAPSAPAAAPAAPAAPAAQAPPAPAAPTGQPAPVGGIVLGPNQMPPYDTPIAWPNVTPGRVNVIQTTKTKLGGDRIVGLIRNDTGAPAFNIRILVTGSDARGNTSPRLQTTGKTYRAYLEPGEIQAFEAQGSIPDPITYNVSVASVPGVGLPAFRDLQAQVTGQTRNSVGWLVVQGTVRNPAAAPRRNVSVVVGGYDAQGNLQDAASGNTTPADLAPGQSGTFSITLPSNTARATDLRVSAEGYDRSAEEPMLDGSRSDSGGSAP